MAGDSMNKLNVIKTESGDEIKAAWWTRDQQRRDVGFVLVEAGVGGKRKIYMGLAQGENEVRDCKNIAANGGKMYASLLKEMFDRLTATNNFE